MYENYVSQWNLVNMSSGDHQKCSYYRNFIKVTVASCISVIMPGDFKLVRTI